MKQCPKCSRDYADDAGFCLQDGNPLVFVAPNPLPPQNQGTPNIFTLPVAANANAPAVDNPQPFQLNQNAPNIFAAPNSNADQQTAAVQPPMYQPVYQQIPPDNQFSYQQMPATNKNSGLRIIKKLLLLAAIPVVLLGLSFFFRLNSVRWFEFIPLITGAIIIGGGLSVIGRMEKK